MNQIQVIPPAIIQGTGFDYASLDDPDLAAEAHATGRRIRSRLRTSYIDTGNDLISIKEKLGHGRFGSWFEAECIMSARSAEECMSAARLATKYAITANLPPTILAALTSPSADADGVKQVLGDAEAGKPTPPTATVKEMLARARAAQKKVQATQKKSPEQIAKERAAEKRRQALLEKRDREHEERWAEIHAREAEVAKEFARGLVVGLGAGGALKLVTSAANLSHHQVKQQSLHLVDGRSTFLTEQEIEVKFGHAAGDA
jgi:hypothetical protein